MLQKLLAVGLVPPGLTRTQRWLIDHSTGCPLGIHGLGYSSGLGGAAQDAEMVAAEGVPGRAYLSVC